MKHLFVFSIKKFVCVLVYQKIYIFIPFGFFLRSEFVLNFRKNSLADWRSLLGGRGGEKVSQTMITTHYIFIPFGFFLRASFCVGIFAKIPRHRLEVTPGQKGW
jgi:hypothetical protein